MSLKHPFIHQFSDEYVCAHCGKSWDVNDMDPPECKEPEPLHTFRPQYRYRENVGWLVLVRNSNPAFPLASVIYATSENEAQGYVGRILRGATALVDVRRLQACDEFATGRTPYSEINPRNLHRAAAAQRCEMISFFYMPRRILDV